MLEIKNVSKNYYLGNVKIEALRNINVSFRRSEFVSILGPSGSGKTTMLNIIGGLDKCDSGELFIDGVSTNNYTDLNWDNYRNNHIGFVFQNYNLIDHLTIYDNIKISLMLSNIPKDEIDTKVKNALEKVGLIEHILKKPSQLSGGQIQRVAIARAIVNDCSIIVADEPTGALDKKTSIEIMNLLKEISKNRLVIMVTHNQELANKYSTRIITIEDGCITSDSNPYKISVDEKYKKEYKNKKLSFLSALKLSFYNLLTKRKRTIITSIAGSIGIIGIAIVLSLTNGVNKYIKDTEINSVSEYPIVIERTTYNVFGNLAINSPINKKCKNNRICISTDKNGNTIKNNIRDFKNYIDINDDFKKYVSSVVSSYDIDLNVYNNKFNKVNSEIFKEIKNNEIDIIYGRLPNSYDEIVIAINDYDSISKELLSSLNVNNLNKSLYTYNEIINNSFKLVLNTDYYKKENDQYISYENDKNYVNNLIQTGLDLKIVGIIKDVGNNESYIGYSSKLTNYLIENISKTDLYKEQINNRKNNIITGNEFDEFTNTYEELERKLGIYEITNPSRISIYAKDYNSKNKIVKFIKKYNDNQLDEDKINYIDMMETLVKGISKVLSIISSVLIFFAGISLIVSSLMISIITYVSVLERTKEIGILKSIGAGKKDIRRIFESETIIEGLLAGVIGIIISLFMSFIINIIVSKLVGINNISILSIGNIVFLILLSIIINLLSGLKSAVAASQKNPVDLLKSE